MICPSTSTRFAPFGIYVCETEESVLPQLLLAASGHERGDTTPRDTRERAANTSRTRHWSPDVRLRSDDLTEAWDGRQGAPVARIDRYNGAGVGEAVLLAGRADHGQCGPAGVLEICARGVS
jgi:hypothetical protein